MENVLMHSFVVICIPGDNADAGDKMSTARPWRFLTLRRFYCLLTQDVVLQDRIASDRHTRHRQYTFVRAFFLFLYWTPMSEIVSWWNSSSSRIRVSRLIWDCKSDVNFTWQLRRTINFTDWRCIHVKWSRNRKVRSDTLTMSYTLLLRNGRNLLPDANIPYFMIIFTSRSVMRLIQVRHSNST